jgi:hypothetical protein
MQFDPEKIGGVFRAMRPGDAMQLTQDGKHLGYVYCRSIHGTDAKGGTTRRNLKARIRFAFDPSVRFHVVAQERQETPNGAE